jgi:hypothetical protein
MQHQILAGIGGIVAIIAIAIILEALGKGVLTIIRQSWLKE